MPSRYLKFKQVTHTVGEVHSSQGEGQSMQASTAKYFVGTSQETHFVGRS